MRLLRTTAQLLRESGQSFALSACLRNPDAEILRGLDPQAVFVRVPSSRWRTGASLQGAVAAATRTVSVFQKRGCERMVVLMPHPWDQVLYRLAHQRGIEVIAVIHDASPHPGERWPTTRSLRWRAQSADRVVTLTNYVAQRLPIDSDAIRVAPHPAIRFTDPAQTAAVTTERTVLFVGRILPYKGIDLLLDAWHVLQDESSRLLIAGEGKRNSPRRLLPRGVDIMNRWLTDAEIENLITNAQVTVLPYLEASQSGVIPLSLALGTPVVATRVGGLPEQFVDGVDGFLCTETTPQALADSLARCLHASLSPSYVPEFNRLWIEALEYQHPQVDSSAMRKAGRQKEGLGRQGPYSGHREDE